MGVRRASGSVRTGPTAVRCQLWQGARIPRSIDHGATWQPVFTGVREYYGISSIVAKDSSQVFASTNIDLLRSDDAGTKWKVVNTGLTTRSGGVLAVDDHQQLWFGMSDLGLYRSANNGENMTYIGFKDIYIRRLLIHTDGDIFVVTSSGTYRSVNGGASWTLLNPVVPNTQVGSLVLNSSGHRFTTLYNGPRDYGVFRSTDYGATWLAVNHGLINLAAGPLAVYADGDIFVSTEGAGVFRSVDNAANWSSASQNLGGVGIYALLEHPGDHSMWAGTRGAGIFRYQKEDNRWVPRNNGLTYPYVTSLAADAKGHLFAGTRQGEILRSRNTGEN